MCTEIVLFVVVDIPSAVVAGDVCSIRGVTWTCWSLVFCWGSPSGWLVPNCLSFLDSRVLLDLLVGVWGAVPCVFCPSGQLNSVIGGRSLSGWMLFLGGLFGSPAGRLFAVAWEFLWSSWVVG